MENTLTRYIIAYQAGPHMETYAAELAATPEEAAAQFQAKHPERAINSVRQADENSRWMYGYGAMTDDEKAEHKERFAAKMSQQNAAAEIARADVATYEPDEFAARIAYEQRRAIEETRNAEGVHVGDLFSCEWGYDQTNVDYYQVTALKGEHTIVVRELRTKRRDVLDTMTGYSRPIRDSFRDEKEYTLRTRLDSDGGSGPRPRGRLMVNAPEGKGTLRRYQEGTPMNYSSYA